MAARASLRASDADREAVAERLRHAAVEGRLEPEELEDRLHSALRARTYGELGRLLDDLPGREVAPAARTALAVALRVGIVLAVVIVALVVIAVTAIWWVAWAFVWLVAVTRRGRRARVCGPHRRRLA
jgi:hypothetical protein